MSSNSNLKDKRYTLTNEYIETERGRLYRIKALKTFEVQNRIVHEGELGGFITSENNLPQQDNSWVFDNAKMYNNSRPWKNACMFDESSMYDNSHGDNSSAMFGNSSMYHHSWLLDNSRMYDNSSLQDDSKMRGNSQIFNHVVLSENMVIVEDAYLMSNSDVFKIELPQIDIIFYKEKNKNFNVCCRDNKLGTNEYTVHALEDFEKTFGCCISITEKGLFWEQSNMANHK